MGRVNFNRKPVIAKKDGEVKEFISIKAASEFANYKSYESMRVLIRKHRGLKDGWKYKYKQ